jgi:2-amino-4-hydroxy-6-hydroxymethyldihydropteridine diphosphokinase
MKQRVIVLLGANLGNRMEAIQTALSELESTFGKPERVSSVYETASWGVEGQPDYLNCVAGYLTGFTADEVLKTLLTTEIKAGRIRKGNLYESRIIDLDLLLYGNLVLNEPGLQVPHPRMTLRRFTMTPLSDIYPEIIHPESNKTMAELLEACTDQGRIKKYIQ